jgi:hypothetical protein
LKHQASPRWNGPAHSAEQEHSGQQQPQPGGPTAVQPGRNPAQLALFVVDAQPTGPDDTVMITLRIDGRSEIIDGMHRLLAFLEVAERASREGV